jgi:hypothetical protein
MRVTMIEFFIYSNEGVYDEHDEEEEEEFCNGAVSLVPVGWSEMIPSYETMS